MKPQDIEFTRVKNDVNGNPRYVVHFLNFFKDGKTSQDFGGLDQAYKAAVKAANKIGGRKFHNKQYGGGIVFQSYNTHRLAELIIENQI